MGGTNMGTMDMVKAAIWSGAGLLLAYVGVHTAETMEELTTAVTNLRITMASIEQKVEQLPPADLMYRLNMMEAEQKRLQRQIDRLENNVPGINGQALPPYSYKPNMDTEEGTG